MSMDNEISIINLQKVIDLDTAWLVPFALQLPEHIAEAGLSSFTVALVSDDRMQQLNSAFRGKAATTDVLSFPHEPEPFETATGADLGSRPYEGRFLGDIVISAEPAAKQADENGLALETEIKQLILHGVLHLCGYDHETDTGEMDARELELREKLGI